MDESQNIVASTIPDHFAWDSLRVSQGACQRAAGNYAAAEKLLLDGYNNQVRRYGADSAKTHFAAAELALAYRELGKPIASKRFEQLAKAAD